MNGDIQYISDSFLVEKIAKLQSTDDVLYKEASIADKIFSGVGPTVSSFVKSNIDTSSTGSLIKSVAKLLAPGIFFKSVHPVLGILYSVANAFNYDIEGMLSGITGKILPKIQSGKQVTPEEVNQAGLAVGGMTTSADLFQDLRDIEKKGELLKAAQYRSQPLGGSFLGNKKAPLLHRMFGFLSQRRKGAGKSLMAGFLVWFIKTILLSAGLLAAGSAVKNLITDDDKESEKTQQPQQNQRTQQTQQNQQNQQIQQTQQAYQPAQTSQTAQTSFTLTPSSAGQKHHANDENSYWYVPVLRGSIENTLLEWTKEIYPKLSEYEDIILRNPSFRRTVSLFEKNQEQGKDFIRVPKQFNRRIDVVDNFVRNVVSDIKAKS